jgi:hypothetical protein
MLWQMLRTYETAYGKFFNDLTMKMYPEVRYLDSFNHKVTDNELIDYSLINLTEIEKATSGFLFIGSFYSLSGSSSSTGRSSISSFLQRSFSVTDKSGSSLGSPTASNSHANHEAPSNQASSTVSNIAQLKPRKLILTKEHLIYANEKLNKLKGRWTFTAGSAFEYFFLPQETTSPTNHSSNPAFYTSGTVSSNSATASSNTAGTSSSANHGGLMRRFSDGLHRRNLFPPSSHPDESMSSSTAPSGFLIQQLPKFITGQSVEGENLSFSSPFHKKENIVLSGYCQSDLIRDFYQRLHTAIVVEHSNKAYFTPI